MYRTERLKKAIRSSIYPVRREEYSAECALFDDDNTRLMKVSLYAGSREEAEKIAEHFKNNAYDMYEQVIGIFADNKEDN